MRHPIIRRLLILVVPMILGFLAACGPSNPLATRSSNIEIDEAIYFLDEGEDRIYAYLAALQAQSVNLREIYYEESENYSLELSIVMSKKFQDKSDQEEQLIASNIADMLVQQIDYSSYYTEFLIVVYSQPLSEVLEGEGDLYSFPMSTWFKDE